MKYTLILITLLLSLTGFSQDFPTPMSPKCMVNDFTGMFSRQELNALEQTLRNFNDTSSTQIAIVTVPSLHGYAPTTHKGWQNNGASDKKGKTTASFCWSNLKTGMKKDR